MTFVAVFCCNILVISYILVNLILVHQFSKHYFHSCDYCFRVCFHLHHLQCLVCCHGFPFYALWFNFVFFFFCMLVDILFILQFSCSVDFILFALTFYGCVRQCPVLANYNAFFWTTAAIARCILQSTDCRHVCKLSVPLTDWRGACLIF